MDRWLLIRTLHGRGAMTNQRHPGLPRCPDCQNDYFQATFRIGTSQSLSRLPAHRFTRPCRGRPAGPAIAELSGEGSSGRKGRLLRWSKRQSRAGTGRAAKKSESGECERARPDRSSEIRRGGTSRIPWQECVPNWKNNNERGLLASSTKQPVGCAWDRGFSAGWTTFTRTVRSAGRRFQPAYKRGTILAPQRQVHPSPYLSPKQRFSRARKLRDISPAGF